MTDKAKSFEELKKWVIEIMKFYTFEMYEAKHRENDPVIKNNSYIEESDLDEIAGQICDFFERKTKVKK